MLLLFTGHPIAFPMFFIYAEINDKQTAMFCCPDYVILAASVLNMNGKYCI
jgi:hypothetical protein